MQNEKQPIKCVKTKSKRTKERGKKSGSTVDTLSLSDVVSENVSNEVTIYLDLHLENGEFVNQSKYTDLNRFITNQLWKSLKLILNGNYNHNVIYNCTGYHQYILWFLLKQEREWLLWSNNEI